MAAFLPVVCVVLAARLFGSRFPPGGAAPGRREALVAGAVSTGLFAVTLAELSSLARRFDRITVCGGWIVFAAVLAALVWRTRRNPAAPPARLRDAGRREVLAILGGLGVLAGPVTLTAAAAAPNNWDSLSYRLPRIAHWIQDAGLFHYPTHIPRQLTLAPAAETLAAHLELLAGSGFGVNLLQTFAWLGAACAASVLAKDFGAGRTGQALAAAFSATLPMAVLQASSTQNDLLLSFWLLAFILFARRAVRARSDFAVWLLAGGSLGLAIATKATALVIAFPFAAAVAAAAIARGRSARWGLAAAGLLALAVNAGYTARNWRLFGSPLGGSHGTVNSAFSPALALSNLSRNMALSLLAPWPSWNAGVEGAVIGLHRVLGVSASDPRTTWRGAEFHVPGRISGDLPSDADESIYAALHEDEAGNPVHALLAAACAVLLFARPRPDAGGLRGFVLLAAAGFVLFSVVLKWQPWGSRLELPFFFFAAPVVGVLLDATRAVLPVAATLLLCSAPWAFLNATRPLLGADSIVAIRRTDQSFFARPGLREPLRAAARAIAEKGCRRIGLELGPDDPEYLIRLSLREVGLSDVRIEHVGVKNRSALLASRPPFVGFAPCAVIAMAPFPGSASSAQMSVKEWDARRISVRVLP